MLSGLAASVRAPDTTPPTVSWQFPTPYYLMAEVPLTIRIAAQDGGGIASVLLNTTQPDGSYVNITVPLLWTFPGGAYHELKRSWPLPGLYTFLAWAVDPSGNWGSAPGNFTMEPHDSTPPTIRDVAAYPAVQAVGGWVTISATVADNEWAVVSSINVTQPDGSHRLCWVLRGLDELKWCEQIWNQVGPHAFLITVIDVPAGNNATATGFFRIVGPTDTTPPVIAGQAASPPTQIAGGAVTVSATITDDLAISIATVDVTRPDTTHATGTMEALGALYRFTANWAQVGAYAFVITAYDIAGKWSAASGSFTITAGDVMAPTITHAPPPAVYTDDPIRIDAIVTDDIGVAEVRLVYTPLGGTEQNVTMTPAGEVYKLAIPGPPAEGSVRYRIYAVDAAGNAKVSGEYSVEVRGRPSAAVVDVGPLVLPIAVLAAIVAAAVAGVVAVLWMRRRSLPPEEASWSPPRSPPLP